MRAITSEFKAIADKEINRFNENEADLDEASRELKAMKHPVSLANYKYSINSQRNDAEIILRTILV
tara:strand:+ start:246 stop:443 length:198 start_codon:yes stop_codon:yes gene_type:complete